MTTSIDSSIWARVLNVAQSDLPPTISQPRKALERTPDGRYSRPLKVPSPKQLWKFAQAQHETIKKFIVDKGMTDEYGRRIAVSQPIHQQSLIELKNRLERTLLGIGKYSKYQGIAQRGEKAWRIVDKIALKNSSRFISELRTDLDNIVYAFSTIHSNVNWKVCPSNYSRLNKQAMTKVPTASFIFGELVSLIKQHEVAWVPGENRLRIKTGPMSLLDLKDKTLRYDLGQFYIYLASDNYVMPQARAVNPRFSRRVPEIPGTHNDYYHPHVQPQGSICFGDGKVAAYKALDQGRLFDLVEITMGVLNTYGKAPYVIIESWRGVCDQRFNPETGEDVPMDFVVPAAANPLPVIRCEMCNADVDRVVTCACAAEVACTGCLNPCSSPGCTRFGCDTCSYHCDQCGGTFCGGSHFSHSSTICNTCWTSNQVAQMPEDDSILEDDDEDEEDDDSDEDEDEDEAEF